MEQRVVLEGEAVLAGEVMRRVKVRPIGAGEVERWKALMRAHHYLGLRHLVGETVFHVAEVDGHWVALLGWCSAALKVSVRDRWIGWTPQQKQRRLKYVAQNGRFLLLTGARTVPNLASRVLAMSVRRLAEDWRAVHGHPVVLAETFVNGERFPGTCYRAAGWVEVGQTEGYAKHNMQYTEHGERKQVFLRPLFRGAEGWLRAPFDAPALAVGEPPAVDFNRIVLQGKDGLLAHLARVPDRRDVHGQRHSQVFILAVVACAVLAGMRGFRAVADFAKGLDPEALRRLGVRPRTSSGALLPPSEPTIRRTMQGIDVAVFEQVLADFARQLGRGAHVAFDGKTLRGSGSNGHKPRHLLVAVTHGTPIALGQRAVGEKTNEIPEARSLLAPLDLRGRVVTGDAMHAQTEIANFLVADKGADYVLIFKDNQKTCSRLLAAMDWSLFPPLHRA
ncbi:MAG: ISAs1 family transposase [Clostridia bacterium]